MITIVVPALPPTVNHMYVALRGGKKALSEQTALFRKLVWAEVLHTPERPCLPDGPLALTVRLIYGTKRRQDLDNRLKSAIDAVALALRFDDCRIARITAECAGYDRGRPLCEMTLDAYAAAVRAATVLENGSATQDTTPRFREICTPSGKFVRARLCVIDGCQNRAYAAHRYCTKHRLRFERAGDPTLTRTRGRKKQSNDQHS